MRRSRVVLYVSGLVAFWGVYGFLGSHGLLLRRARIHTQLVRGTVAKMCNEIFRRPISRTNFDDINRNNIIKRVQLLRLYGHCYLRAKVRPSPHVDLEEVERQLFPVLKFSAYEAQKNASGRGIIMSMGSTGVEDLNGLIKVLDSLDNKLPIQIYHKNDIAPSHLHSIDFGNQNVELIDAQKFIPEGISE